MVPSGVPPVDDETWAVNVTGSPANGEVVGPLREIVVGSFVMSVTPELGS